MRRKWIMLSFILCMLLSGSMAIFAQELDFGRTGSISVTLIDQEEEVPVVGAKLVINKRMSIVDDGAGNWKYVYGDKYRAEGITDSNGTVVFRNLSLGVYEVEQIGTVEGFAPCKAFEVTIPINSENGYAYDVDASPKTEAMKLTSIRIKKVWNTGKSTKAADSVTVQLLREGEVVKTAVLNEENGWTMNYDNMPVSDAYSIKEKNVPNGFTATYSQKGYEFTVTNTAALAQTGQLVWPIPLLTAAGLFFISLGGIIMYKTRRNDA